MVKFVAMLIKHIEERYVLAIILVIITIIFFLGADATQLRLVYSSLSWT